MSDKAVMTAEAVRAKEEFLFNTGVEAQRKWEEPKVLDIDGYKYMAFRGTVQRVQTVKPDKPEKPDVFEAFSLGGLVDFIKTDVDGLFQEANVRHIVRVVNTKRVEVLTPMHGFYKERDLVAKCEALVPLIPFDKFMDVDEFQIMLQSRFADSDNRAKVLLLSGSLRTEQTGQIADDGVSQKVTINRGVATAENVTVKNPVVLRPLRTFYEVEQPDSPFILRFDENARAALFEGDGGAWKLRAVENIKNWLAAKLKDCNVEVIA